MSPGLENASPLRDRHYNTPILILVYRRVCFVFVLVERPQEKEFEVTNEYIFALGSHVIYWTSKDVSLFIAQQVVADAVAADDVGAA